METPTLMREPQSTIGTSGAMAPCLPDLEPRAEVDVTEEVSLNCLLLRGGRETVWGVDL